MEVAQREFAMFLEIVKKECSDIHRLTYDKTCSRDELLDKSLFTLGKIMGLAQKMEVRHQALQNPDGPMGTKDQD